METHEVRLPGCRPVPLASYLKGLAVLRLVAEQQDPDARGCFAGDVFVLRSSLDEDALVEFFLERYRPTPVVSPWNGGSGFYPKDNRTALDAIAGSSGERFGPFRRAIAAGASALASLGIGEKPQKQEKNILLTRCRNRLPDEALAWFDAALLLGNDGPKFPPLLGTGGNDGRLDFTNNLMQRLVDVVDPESDLAAAGSRERLRSGLFAEPYPGGVRGAKVGQFLPGDAGGANSGAGFDGGSAVNPWDFVLMIEGALLFAAAAVRRLESGTRDALAYPFTVRPVSAGYGSAAEAEESRGEIWLPVWTRPARASEVRALFSEGRARVGRRTARDGMDFARALATLGVDRGVASFQRYGFHVRNGLSSFATPLDRLPVRCRQAARLVEDVDPWLESFRRRGDLPGSVTREVRGTERAILALCRTGERSQVQGLLVALGRLEAALARSLAFAKEKRIPPAPRLPSRWLARAGDGSAELRLAASLAGAYRFGDRARPRPLASQVEPVGTSSRGPYWRDDAGREVVPESGDAVTWLNRILSRRILDAVRDGIDGWGDRSPVSAGLADVADFVEGRTDDRKLVDLFRGLVLVDWRRVEREDRPHADRRASPRPDGLYALTKLCFAGRPVREVRVVPLVPAIHVRAATGDGESAATAAVRRLRGSGLPPRLGAVHREGKAVRRAAAALLFPLGERQIRELADSVLPPTEETTAAGEGGEGGG